jgi:hypothetical protein
MDGQAGDFSVTPGVIAATLIAALIRIGVLR